MKTTKAILVLLLLTASIPFVRAQDAVDTADQVLYTPVPAVVYDAPVTYQAPAVYQAPVVYNAPVYYTAPVACPPVPVCAAPPAPSTVVYIGRGHVGYQSSYCNSGSTVTFIGGGSRFR